MVFKNKRGIGIIEVMVAALVLGILYAAVSNLQKGNRDALLRIRGRDGATEVAQNVIDRLGAMGLAQFTNANLKQDDDGTYWLKFFSDDEWNKWKNGAAKKPDTIQIDRTWKGQPGLAQPHAMTVTYDVVVAVSPDDDYKASATTQLLQAEAIGSAFSHVFAKRVDVIVSWKFKSSTQSISVSGVIR